MACQGFLFREAFIGVLVGEVDLFSLKCNEVSSSEFLGVSGFGVTLGSLYINAQGYVLHCWRISVIFLALELVGSWVELSFSVGMEALG